MGQHKSKNTSLEKDNMQLSLSKDLHLKLSNCTNINEIVKLDDGQEATPVWISTYYGDVNLTNYLISLGADVNIACGNLKMTPLLIACHGRSIELVKLLLETGAKANVMNTWNFTPSLYAVLHNDPFTVDQILTLLIKHGCDMNYGAVYNHSEDYEINTNIGELDCKYGSYCGFNSFCSQPQGPISGTPMLHAASNPYIPNEVLTLIYEAGGDINYQNLHGQTPLMCAIMDIYYDYHQNIQHHIHFLFQKGADVNIQDRRGWTALHYASQRGGLSAIQSLLSVGANPNIAGTYGETPFWLLLCYGWKNEAKYLIKDGCDLNTKLLTTAIVKFNSDVDLPRYGAISPLEFVLCNRYFDIAKLLIIAGCEVDNEFATNQARDEISKVKFEQIHALFCNMQDPLRLWSLKDLSCRATRNAYHHAMNFKLDKLGVPQIIKHYILLEIT